MFKVLLWDMDGTILNFLAAERNAIRKTFESFGFGECTDEMIAVYSPLNKRYWEALERREKTKKQILVERFEEFFGLYGLDTSRAEEFNAEYQYRLGDTIVFYDNAFDLLRSLKGKFIQCAVTNGTRKAQERKLRNSGLDTIFDHIFISEDVGYEKPDVRFFRGIFETIGHYEPSEMLIIGDSLTSDMKGGVDAGIPTCWYNPEGKPNNSGLKLNYEIRDLNDVLAILK